MTEREISRVKVEKARKVNSLLQNKDFVDIILVEYMKESIHDLMYREGASNGTLKGIEARKSLNDFLYGLIDEGKIAEGNM